MFWQLVFIGGMSYNDVKKLDWDELLEGYEALKQLNKDSET